MTLEEAIERGGHRMQAGDFEFVEGPDGLAHFVMCSKREMRGGRDPEYIYSFVTACEDLPKTRIGERVIAKRLTCMSCGAKNFVPKTVR